MSKEYTRALTVFGSVPFAGSIIFHDDFEGILRWISSGTGADPLIELDPSTSFHRNQSLYLRTRITDPAANDDVAAVFYSHLLPSKTLTCTLHFHLRDLLPLKTFELILHYFDGTDKYTAAVRWIKDPAAWEYLDSEGAHPDLNIPEPTLHPLAWHILTLRVNFFTLQYIDFKINNQLINMDSIALCPTLEDTTPVTLATQISLITAADAPASANIDELILHEL